MISRDIFASSFFQSFLFRKVVPGVLIGLLATQFDPSIGNDAVTFMLCMIVFWAAIGVGHGLAELTIRSES